MTPRVKNTLSLLLRFGLSGALLLYLFNKMDKDKMIEVVKNADLNFIILALIIYFIVNIIILIRWDIFIRALGLKVPLRSVVRCFFIGSFFNLFLPSSTGGDVVKMLGLFRDTPEKAKVVASVVLDRLWGFVSIVIVALGAFAFGYRYIRDNSILISIFILGTVSVLMILVLFNERLYEFVCRVFNKLPHIKEKLMRLHYAIILVKTKYRELFITVGLSCLNQVILAFDFYLIARALHQDIPMIYFLIFVPLICVVSALPSIGGLGVRDAGAAFLFAKIGMSTATAVSMSLISFLFMIAVGLTGGVIYVTTVSSRRVQPDQAASGLSP